MAVVSVEIEIDAELLEQAAEIFRGCGLDFSGAVNEFLRDCVARGALPFAVDGLNYNAQTLAAMAEAREISRDDSVPGFDSVDALRAALAR